MPTLTKEARGPFVYSLLDGDALTAVERLEFAEFAIDRGEILIFNMLEARYPDKDPIDRAGKALFDVFEVAAKEGERLSEWSARAESVFHACQRDAGIAFFQHGEGIFVSASLWSVGRSESSGAGSHWRHVRNCIDCTSSEVVLSGVPKMAWKTWRNSSMRTTRVTLPWTKTKSERCWRPRGNKNDKKSRKKDFVEGLENRRNRRRLPQREDSSRKWKS